MFFFLVTLGTFSPALEIFEVRRPELHLCEFYRVLVALPVEPVDPLQGGGGEKKRKGGNQGEKPTGRTVRFIRGNIPSTTRSRGKLRFKIFQLNGLKVKNKRKEKARKPSRSEERNKSLTLL